MVAVSRGGLSLRDLVSGRLICRVVKGLAVPDEDDSWGHREGVLVSEVYYEVTLQVGVSTERGMSVCPG